MGLPGDLETVTVTGTFLSPSGQPLAGSVSFTPSAALADATGKVLIRQVPAVYWLRDGSLTAAVAATDNADLSPSPFTYTVTAEIGGASPWSFVTAIPHSPSPVDLSVLGG